MAAVCRALRVAYQPGNGRGEGAHLRETRGGECVQRGCEKQVLSVRSPSVGAEEHRDRVSREEPWPGPSWAAPVVMGTAGELPDRGIN